MPKEEEEPQGHYKTTKKKVVTLKTPKHPEEYSTRESYHFTPWRVVLKVALDKEEYYIVDYEIFLRAKCVEDAQWLAYYCFMSWEHNKPGIPIEDPPYVATSVDSEAEALEEDQYMEFWKEAQSYPHVYNGMAKNPTIFKFSKPGWDQPKNHPLYIPKAPQLVLPDQQQIDAVSKSKSRDER